MKRLLLAAALASAAPLDCAAEAQTYQDAGGTYVRGVVPIQPGVGPLFTSANPGKISGSFSATFSGFQPSASGSVGTPISAQITVAAGSTQTLPTGTVVIASNVGASNVAYCQLGATASTSSQPIAPGGGWFAFTVGSATQLTCVTSGGTTAVNTLGGSGLPTGAGGGAGGGGSNASVGLTGTAAPGSATYNGMLVSGGNMVGAAGSAWGSAPTGLNVLGVNANVLSSALPSGAATAANQEVTAAGTTATSAQAVQGVTGGVPMPANAANTGGSLTTIVQAGASVPISVSTATTTQLVAAVTGKAIYVTAWDVIAAGTGSIMLEYGTGANCGTGTTALTGAYSLTAQVGIAKGNGLGPVLVAPAGNALCTSTSAAVQMSGSVSYTQF
jgi:fibronectin-binding autotransporter adhesin